ncbi:MAG: phospholipase [Chloroflexota bacterium]|nr:MAG: phospholipase [Chloroflexota bacterium]
MVHGRGATAESILTLADALDVSGLTLRAPSAAGNVWYPRRFMEPIASNEPFLSSALAALAVLVRELSAAVEARNVVLLGFSQGACLVLEYAARNARRFGGIIGLSGGLIGEPGTRWEYPGSLDGTPVLLGCSDVDFHIPEARVRESAEALTALGARVDCRIYPGMGHTVNQDEMDAVQAILHDIR